MSPPSTLKTFHPYSCGYVAQLHEKFCEWLLGIRRFNQYRCNNSFLKQLHYLWKKVRILWTAALDRGLNSDYLITFMCVGISYFLSCVCTLGELCQCRWVICMSLNVKESVSSKWQSWKARLLHALDNQISTSTNSCRFQFPPRVHTYWSTRKWWYPTICHLQQESKH